MAHSIYAPFYTKRLATNGKAGSFGQAGRSRLKSANPTLSALRLETAKLASLLRKQAASQKVLLRIIEKLTSNSGTGNPPPSGLSRTPTFVSFGPLISDGYCGGMIFQSDSPVVRWNTNTLFSAKRN